MTFEQSLQNKIQQAKQAGLYRAIKPFHTNQILNFASNDYLSLTTHPQLLEYAQKALADGAVGSTGARLITGNTRWHEQLEEKIATYKQTEAALIYSAGYLANIGVLSALAEKGDVILSDRLNHASLIDGCRLAKANLRIYNHIDMEDLQQQLQQTASYNKRFIVTDGVFSMDGTIAPLPEIMKLANEYDAIVIVDDAHATGILGETGAGTAEYFGVHPHVVIGTMSKAVGTEGGFVAGSKILIDFLRNYSRPFIFQTAMSPILCAASCAAFEVMAQEPTRRKRVLANAHNVKKALSEMGYEVRGDETPILPVIIGGNIEALQFSQLLYEEGIFAPAIRPPTVAVGESRIRLTMTAGHTDEELQKLLEAFQRIGQKLNIIKERTTI